MPSDETLASQLEAYMKAKDFKGEDVSSLARGLGISSKERPALRELIRAWENKGKLLRLKNARYILREAGGSKEEPLEGRVRRLPSGKTLFIPSRKHDEELQRRLGGEPPFEFVIPSYRQGGAMDGDRVKARVRLSPPSGYRRRQKGRPSLADMTAEVKVEEIISRRSQNWVGIYRAGHRYGTVVGDGKSSPTLIEVSEVPPPGLLSGMCVVLEPESYPLGKMSARGRIVEQLGWPDDAGVEIKALIKRFGLQDTFPQVVLDETLAISSEIAADERARRQDWSERCVVTIDPITARDYDDAISVRRLDTGGWELAVHIADVAHYVPPNSALDKEAELRGNSTYLPDRVLPMLPPRLCDDICSLREGEPRLTRLCLMRFDETATLTKVQFHLAFINSRQRLNYAQVLELIEGHIKSLGDEEVDTMLHEAYHLSSLLRRKRFTQGALDLEMPQFKMILDDEGRATGIEFETSDAAHALIEEFMLAANECVAKALREKMLPAVYRVHEEPDSGKLHEFALKVQQAGIKCGALTSRDELCRVTSALKGAPDEMLLKMALLRSLMRARYAPTPLGHFGLALGDYCHFTSPIRRYADLIIHRSFTQLCPSAEVSQRPILPQAPRLASIADHISETERTSAAAENEALQLKLMEYMQQQCEADEPQVWKALIVACWPQGIAVELPQIQLKGFVSAEEMPPEAHWFYESHVQRWRSTEGEQYLAGQELELIPCKVDVLSRFVEFKLAPSRSTAKDHSTL